MFESVKFLSIMSFAATYPAIDRIFKFMMSSVPSMADKRKSHFDFTRKQTEKRLDNDVDRKDVTSYVRPEPMWMGRPLLINRIDPAIQRRTGYDARRDNRQLGYHAGGGFGNDSDIVERGDLSTPNQSCRVEKASARGTRCVQERQRNVSSVGREPRSTSIYGSRLDRIPTHVSARSSIITSRDGTRW